MRKVLWPSAFPRDFTHTKRYERGPHPIIKAPILVIDDAVGACIDSNCRKIRPADSNIRVRRSDGGGRKKKGTQSEETGAC